MSQPIDSITLHKAKLACQMAMLEAEEKAAREAEHLVHKEAARVEAVVKVEVERLV
jgi:hypothetical protein